MHGKRQSEVVDLTAGEVWDTLLTAGEVTAGEVWDTLLV